LVEPASKDKGYSYTVAPQIIKGKVIVGISGSDFGERAFIDALDINTGKQIWRFWCVPGPGEKGRETWKGDSWKTGAGSPWMPVTYDKDSNTIYTGTGNPGPGLDGSKRLGDTLYTECMVALDADTGKLKWHFQVIPHDVWDLDNVVEGVVDDITIDGKSHKALLFASKKRLFYALDV
jgi:alcohol dehydrogenase (cytochrome c)